MKKTLLVVWGCLSLPVLPANSMSRHDSVVIDNGVVRRCIDISGGSVSSSSLTLLPGGREFLKPGSEEFAFIANGTRYTGNDMWQTISLRDTVAVGGGKGVVISLRKREADISVGLCYMSYPETPVIRKSLTITNTGTRDICLEEVDVESLRTASDPVHAVIMRQYARYRWFGPYEGDWNDPLVAVHFSNERSGIVIGNEAAGVVKRIAAYTDGKSLTAGTTHRHQPYPFRKWLLPGGSWTSPAVFCLPYDGSPDPREALNTSVPDFVRRRMDIRLEKLDRKPVFVYNTWSPFRHGLDEKLILELAEAAAGCGVAEFVIDDGWQANIDPADGGYQLLGDWEVDRRKFPNGLRPVFDRIRELGMKPGLWLSLAAADVSAQAYKHHPEWMVRNSCGDPLYLHDDEGTGCTMCMATGWMEFIRDRILAMVAEYGLAYVKLDLAVVTSAYIYDTDRSGCCAAGHPFHRDREESLGAIYERCLQLFDELHAGAPGLFIDCTFETAGKLHMMDYGLARHAEGNWLSNIEDNGPDGILRIRQLAWGRTPVIPASALVIGNTSIDGRFHELAFKSLAGTLPIMLGDPRALTLAEKERYREWTHWLARLEESHSYMSFRQDLPGFGEPAEGSWDGFARINTESGSGGLVGVFRHGSHEKERMVAVPWVDRNKTYEVRCGPDDAPVARLGGAELATGGFRVRLDDLYDGRLFEISETGPLIERHD